MLTQKSICIFPHFSLKNQIPYYVQIYVIELSNYFDKVLIVTNKREIDNSFSNPNIEILFVENQGYDFGMFYKGYQHIKHKNYTKIACINDSNIVFGSLKPIFDWAGKTNFDFWGLVDSENRPSYSTHTRNYHLQSHFLVFNQLAISYLDEYFENIDIEKIFKIVAAKEVKKLVIDQWEIGLSQFLLNKKLNLGAYFSVNNLSKFTHFNGTIEKLNISLDLFPAIIDSGVPILKKKIITSIKPKHIFSIKKNGLFLIRKHIDKSLNVKQLINELREIRNLHIKMRLLQFIRQVQ